MENLPPSAIQQLEQGRKIGAIKALREERGLGLKQAKDVVEAYLVTRPDLLARVPPAQFRWSWVVGAIVASLLIYAFLKG